MAILGAGQGFGEDEVVNKSPVRRSKAVVKSLNAEVLILPIEVLNCVILK